MKDKFKGRLLVCDMDGTLLNDSRCISSENIKALEYFVDNGGTFTVGTGRMLKAVKSYCPQLPINAPGIIYNGAVIYDFNSEKILWETNLPPETEELAYGLNKKFPSIGLEVFSCGDIHLIKYNEEIEKHRQRENFSLQLKEIRDIPKPWIKLLAADKPSDLKPVEEYIKSFKGNFRWVYSEPQFIEVLPINSSKGHALQRLCSIIGFDIKNAIAIGDNLNDLEMVNMAGVGIAVDNAHEELKKCADRCCGNNNSHIIKEIIELMDNNQI